jgi:hypothetical protein
MWRRLEDPNLGDDTAASDELEARGRDGTGDGRGAVGGRDERSVADDFGSDGGRSVDGSLERTEADDGGRYGRLCGHSSLAGA